MKSKIGVWYLRQRLSTKLVLPSVLIVFLLLTAGIFLFFLVKSQQNIQATYETELESFRNIAQLQADYKQIQMGIYKAIALVFAGIDLEEQSETLEKTLNKQKELELKLTKYQKALNQSKTFFKWGNQVLENLDDPLLAAANMVTTESKFNGLNETLNNVLEIQKKRMNKSAIQTQKNLSKVILWQLLTILIIAVIAIGASLLNQKIIKTFIKKLQTDVNTIAKGDLTHSLEVSSNDELGSLAYSVDEMRKNFFVLLTDLTKAGLGMATSSSSLKTLSKNLSLDAEMVGDRTEVIHGATNEISEQSKLMAVEAGQVTASAITTSNSIVEMEKTILEIAQNCANESDMVRKTAIRAKDTLKDMEELGKASHEIGSILKLMNDISSKTSLLALNATIEAASAGDAGKGFAVVAGEVKALAGQSTNAALQIHRKIQAIREQSETAIKAVIEINNSIQEFSKISDTIASTVEEQSATIGEISRNVTLVTDSSGSLAQSINAMAEKSEKVRTAIADVQLVAKDTVLKAESSSNNADELATLSENLKYQLSKFKL